MLEIGEIHCVTATTAKKKKGTKRNEHTIWSQKKKYVKVWVSNICMQVCVVNRDMSRIFFFIYI